MVSPRNFQKNTFKNTSVNIFAKFILFLYVISFMMCEEIQLFFCLIMCFNFLLESLIPICDTYFQWWYPRWGIISRWGVYFGENMNSTIQTWFLRHKKHIKTLEYFLVVARAAKPAMSHFSWLPWRLMGQPTCI